MGTGRGITPKAKRLLAGALVLLSVGNVAALAVHDPPSSADPTVTATAASTPPSVTASSALPAGTPTTTMAPSKATRPTGTEAAKEAEGRESARTASPTTTTTVNAAAQLWPLRNEGYDYVLTLTPTCAKPGESFTATMHLKPTWGSGGLFKPFYADGSSDKGKGASPEQGGDGTITHTWVARPVPGEGRLVTQAHDPETDQNGTKVISFRVAEVGKSC